jgi:hypothetical protein
MTEENAPTTQFELDGFGGELLRPSDEGYDDARRVFNGMIDRRPALIARCAKAADVVAAVNLAREENLPLSIYGGGHGVTGSAVVDAGICIDLRGMKGVTVDAETRTVRARACDATRIPADPDPPGPDGRRLGARG